MGDVTAGKRSRIPGTAGEPSFKRPRFTPANRGADGYSPGNILQIEIQNFMTYSHLISKPGPRLNLVIGPNGTGKSSLVCAIAIGLAGEPQLLGRASSIGDYVKRGEESGWVKLTLRGMLAGETVEITRRINKQNKSDWLLNGRAVPKRDILDLVQQFNIQVNNLTQFLPQDRVCEFAKMTPIQLLEETEKAVGDPELSRHHQFLIEKTEELKKLEVIVGQHDSHLKELKSLNAERERDVERVRQRNELLLKAELMKKKRPWLVFDSKRQILLKQKEKEKQSKKNVQGLAQKMIELRAPIDMKKGLKDEAEAACKKILAAKAKLDSRRSQLTEKENHMSVQVKSKLAEIEELHSREMHREERIDKARQELQAAELELSNIAPYEPPRAEIETLSTQIHELELLADEKKRQKQEKEGLATQKRRLLEHCVKRLEHIESFGTRRLQALKDSGARHIFEAYQWVQDHRNEFQMDVYGPVLLEVNLSNQDYAAYLEGHVAGYIWKAFVTQNPHDRDLLNINLKKFGVPVLNFVPSADKSSPSLTAQMQDLGIKAKLIDVFTAPPIVKEVLRTQAMLGHSFVGTSETNRQADQANKLGVMDLWTPENHYHWQASRYGGHISASVMPVRPARIFSHSVDMREQRELQQKKLQAEDALGSIDNELRHLSIEQRQLEDDAAKLHRQREGIINVAKTEKKKRQDLANRVEQRQRKLEMIRSEEDSQSAEQRIRVQIHDLNKMRHKGAIEIKDLLHEAVSIQKQYLARRLCACEVELKIREMERSVKLIETEGTKAQQEYDHCKRSVEECRRAVEAAKVAAENIAKLTPEIKQQFAEMPDTIADLDDAIQENMAEANAVLCLNDSVLEEYEARCRMISSLSAKLDEEATRLNECKQGVEAIKDKWLPTLRGLVSRINVTFSRNFQEMAVAGEVALDEHGNNFSQYGILIKVKFRETGELQVLSAHHQSGGERSVSTILYLVSLQDLTHCPFRVVDEINQGMDPINERKMFQQLVRAASEPNTPQCFLLTPKLLPDLEYTDACTILNIMNGPWIDSPAKVWGTGSSWSAVVESLSQASQASQHLISTQ
ncbi:hypothetical protein GOP47_0020257 [Adiantum capillus-veneris]|uniref:Structural maintenance of chromosomes protein 5 n=1 Tax=Adiantum capillus-veneris TaxID=13818 RepID=A0A9D4UDB3_ADICA|nr:hypothetical protein GOP47_0019621 [Adiantum capillus-veneris]KAI5065562.1 hypothetical protein GOP47_0020257 [Adiantum capillus-veneris]